MPDFRDHFSGHAAAYAAARPDYPPELFAWLAERAPARQLAWDCATGNGQAALALAEHFDHVHATDASREQIASAKPHERIRYAVAAAQASALPTASADLISVAQAVHWFDRPAFYREAARVLKSGGLLAVWGYGLTRITPAIDRVMDFFDTEIVGPHWPSERRHIDNAYAAIGFPYPRIRAPAFEMRKQWNLRELLAYLDTWSAVRRYRAARGHDPLAWLCQELAPVWGAPDERRDVRWPLFLLAGHKPG